MSVSIPVTIFENHNVLMLLATSNLWALLWSSPCQVHWRTIGRMMVGQFLSNQLWCGVGLSCCWWFDQRRGGAVKLLGLLTNAPCAIKSKIMIVVAGLQFKQFDRRKACENPQFSNHSAPSSHIRPGPTYPSITYSQISRPRTKETKHQHNNLTFLQTTLFCSIE